MIMSWGISTAGYRDISTIDIESKICKSTIVDAAMVLVHSDAKSPAGAVVGPVVAVPAKHTGDDKMGDVLVDMLNMVGTILAVDTVHIIAGLDKSAVAYSFRHDVPPFLDPSRELDMRRMMKKYVANRFPQFLPPRSGAEQTAHLAFARSLQQVDPFRAL